MRRLTSILLLLLAAPVALAQEPFFCGTSPANDARVEALGEWLAARDADRASKGLLPASNVYAKNNVVVLPGDDSTVPFRQPFDLLGKSLTFTRVNATTFNESTGPLVWEEQFATALFSNNQTRSATYTIAGFDFPFFGRTAKTLYISQLQGIYLDPVPPVPVSSFYQYNDAEALAGTQAVIAPMLTTSTGLAGRYPSIYARELADRVVVTWSQATGEGIQAVLFKNGDIRFSYRNIGTTRAGVLLVTSGNEPWRTTTSLGSVTDSASDVSTTFPTAMLPILDITSVDISRIGNSNLLQITFKTRGAIDRAAIGAGSYALYQSRINGINVNAWVSGDGPGSDALIIPSWGTSEPSPAMRVSGDTVTAVVAQEMWLPTGVADADVFVLSSYSRTADTATVRVHIDPAPAKARTSFATMPAGASMSGPIEETFTLPILSTAAVWNAVRNAFQLDPTEYDGVAIYQNFYTDIIFYAGAYSTGGNPGVDNIESSNSRSRSSAPRSPALLHMNTIRYRYNSNDRDAAFLLMHEFGHRWLQRLNIMQDDGSKTNVLNPVTSHPAQYVDTRAAFNVNTSSDASVMGGSAFTDNHDGSFSTPSDPFTWSYSWLDLYLMGLAPPEEVPPFFYLANSQPALGGEYNPPFGSTYVATRKDLTIDNVVQAMGKRNPAFPNTQRSMRVLFVLVSDPAQSVSDDDVNLVNGYARVLANTFATATGNRAAITSAFAPAPPPRRRAAGK